MSRKNRNGQRQAKRPLNLKGIQMSMSIPTDAQAKTAPAAPKPGFVQSASEVKMLDTKCSYQFTRLPSTILESDTSYQRPIDMKRVQRIVDNFDRRLVNPLKVSLRDGHYYVFDGAHTLSVLKEVNKFDNFMVDCMLMHGLTYEDEAYLFALQRGESKEVATTARLKALMLSNDEAASDFRTRTELTGFKLAGNGHTSSKGCIGCVAKLWKIYEDNPELYSETLSIHYGSVIIENATALRAAFGNSARLQWEWLRMDEDRYGVISSSDSRLSNDGFSLTLGPQDVDTSGNGTADGGR